MDSIDLFCRHAQECREMAKAVRDPESKASWNRIADRWLRCAELEAGRVPPARPARYRRPERATYKHAS